jgi:hypothetical protein
MNRTSTIRTVAMTLALVSSAASMSQAQYRNNAAFARGDTTAPIKTSSARDSSRRNSSVVAHPLQQSSSRPSSNFYVGFAAGASMPSGEFGNAYENGWNVAVPIGWRPANGPLGMRLDIAYSKWGGATLGGVKLSSAAVWDGMLDATVDMPFGANKTSSLYVVGGGGLHYFPDYGGEYSQPTTGDTTTPPPPGGGYQLNTVVTNETSSTTRFGLNGGAGLSFGLPHSALFVETRYVTVFTKDERTNYWPVVAGIKWSMR